MTPKRLPHSIGAAAASAISAIREIRPGDWAAGVITSALNFVGQDVWAWFFILAVGACLSDVHWGSRAARYRAEYDGDRRRRGMDTKLITLQVLMGFRAVEYLLATWGLLSAAHLASLLGWSSLASHQALQTNGIGSTAVTVAVLLHEGRSVWAHRRAMGGRRVELIDATLDAARATERRAGDALRGRRRERSP